MSIVVTPEMVAAVEKAKCFACGKFPWQRCARPEDRDRGREFEGGTREPTHGHLSRER